MSGPAWTTTYQVALGGGYGALTVDCVSALPDWSATTWFRARAMLPRWSQLPTWMCEIWDDEAWSPLIFNSTMVAPCGGVTMMVPAAVVVAGGAGAIGKVRPTGADVREGVGATGRPATTAGGHGGSPPHGEPPPSYTLHGGVGLDALGDGRNESGLQPPSVEIRLCVAR